MTNLTYTASPDTLWHRYDDSEGQSAWTAWHAIRHRTYRKEATRRGFPIQYFALEGDLDDDWFHRHQVSHQTLRSLFPASIGQLTVSLDPFRNQPEFQDWMRRHGLMHARIDAFLGVI